MKVTVYLKAETPEDEEAIKTFMGCHFQTHVQEFLEDEADEWGHHGASCSLPDMIYINLRGDVIGEVRQGHEVIQKTG